MENKSTLIVVQEAVTRTIPKENKCKKAKWLSEEALQIAEKRREAKGEKEREGYANCTLVAARQQRRGEGTLLPFNGRQNLWLSYCVGLFMGTLCNKSLPVNLGNFPVCF